MKKNIFLLALFFLLSCAQTKPFVDSRREAGQEQPVGQSTSDVIAVCYNPLWSKKTTADQLALEECQKTNRKAVYFDKRWFSGYLITPVTTFYKCEK